jgi:hypothetical protein
LITIKDPQHVFDVEDRELAAAQKEHWLRHSDLQIVGNEPLTQLLEQLRAPFRKQLIDKDTTSVEVEYDTLMVAIDSALSRPDWPDNDGCTTSIAFSPQSASRLAKDASRASSKKRKTESKATSTSSKRGKKTPSPSGLYP